MTYILSFLIIGDGVFFNDVMINHGIVTRESIMTTEATAVQCRTTATNCCSGGNVDNGDWIFTGGGTVSTNTGTGYYQVKQSGSVHLQRNSGTGEGIFRCVIIGPAGSEVTYYIGVYTSGNGE